MIDVALIYIRQVLDEYLSVQLGVDKGCVILNNLSASDPAILEQNRNKVVVTLVNLEYESNKQFYGGQVRAVDQVNQVNPALFFNLDILLSASFDNYIEALKQLTLVVAFFQEHLSLDRTNSPALPEGLSALKFEIENSPSHKAHDLWTALGVGYLPSMLYKVRHVAVQSGQIKGSSTTVREIAGTVHP
ncbi:Pvc16 family protein [Pseudomonas sp. MWU13-2105]|uniref:Pvc16 family protein n=1 Tax=Pseudomonas sp. MWU13-2105 TaxID=2935074 RepID=UPI00200FC37B|nr:Pvc16 family protein [Pseudomonas sp. MWU13-2105]